MEVVWKLQLQSRPTAPHAPRGAPVCPLEFQTNASTLALHMGTDHEGSLIVYAVHLITGDNTPGAF